MRNSPAIDVVSAAYRLEADEASWLAGIGRSAAGCFESARDGVVVSVVRPKPDGFSVRTRVTVPGDSDLSTAVEATETLVPSCSAASMHRRQGCITASEFTIEQGLGVEALRAVYAPYMSGIGVRDAFNVQGTMLGPLSVVFSLPLAAETQLHAKLRHTWDRVAAHMAAGLRLREALSPERRARVLDSADAVMAADGRCLHANLPEASSSARERLRAAARAVDRASRRATNDSDEALELWRGLFDGTWSVLEHFDSDGKRFLVAFRNDPLTAEDRSLTRRERQVVSQAAFGQSDRIIAYAMGLSHATVRTHLRRALAKLGLESTTELRALADVVFDRLHPSTAG